MNECFERALIVPLRKISEVLVLPSGMLLNSYCLFLLLFSDSIKRKSQRSSLSSLSQDSLGLPHLRCLVLHIQLIFLFRFALKYNYCLLVL